MGMLLTLNRKQAQVFGARKLMKIIIFFGAVLYIMSKWKSSGVTPPNNVMVNAVLHEGPYNDLPQQMMHPNDDEPEERQDDHPHNAPVFVTMICQENNSLPNINLTRQVEQAKVLLKSAVSLTKSLIRFVIATDNKELFDQIEESTHEWPIAQFSNIHVDYKKIWYSEDNNEMVKTFGKCSVAKLSMTEFFQGEDAVIFVDTDFIFMTDPQNLWDEFKNFNSTHVAGMGPSLFYYNDRNFNDGRIPYLGKSGIDAGVMLMNLTRMQDLIPLSFGEGILYTFHQYSERFDNGSNLADMDIFNIYFKENPDNLYLLNCKWNYRKFQCWNETLSCPEALEEGASLVHGSAFTFFLGEEQKFTALFHCWKNYKMGDTLASLYKNIREGLSDVDTMNLPSRCKKFEGIDEILSKELKKHSDPNDSK